METLFQKKTLEDLFIYLGISPAKRRGRPPKKIDERTLSEKEIRRRRAAEKRRLDKKFQQREELFIELGISSEENIEWIKEWQEWKDD